MAVGARWPAVGLSQVLTLVLGLEILLSGCGGSSLAPLTSTSTHAPAMPSATVTATAATASAPTGVYLAASGGGAAGAAGGTGPCCTVYALNPSDGSERWHHTLSIGVAWLAVAGAVVYAVTYDRHIVALRIADGTQLWQVSTHYLVSPIVVAGGEIYTGSAADSQTDGFVNAHRASDGQRLWEYDGGKCSYTVAADAAAVYASPAGCQRTLVALRANDGSVLWQSSSISAPSAASAVAAGVVYVNAAGDVNALRAADGQQLWHTHVGTPVGGASAPAVASGVVYASAGMDVYALRAADGSQLWTAHFSKVLPGPVVANGTVYLAMQDQLIALAGADGTVRWQVAKPGGFSYPAEVAGVVYVIAGPGASPSSDYTVYALRAADGSILWTHQGSDAPITPAVVG